MDLQEDSLKIDLTAEPPKSGDLTEEFSYLDSNGIRRAMPPGLIRRLIDVKEREEWIAKQREDKKQSPSSSSSFSSPSSSIPTTEFVFAHPREFEHVAQSVPCWFAKFDFAPPDVFNLDGTTETAPPPPMHLESSPPLDAISFSYSNYMEVQRKYEEEMLQYSQKRCDWIRVKNGDGHMFFLNRKTRESQWDAPTDDQGGYDEHEEIYDYSWPVITID